MSLHRWGDGLGVVLRSLQSSTPNTTVGWQDRLLATKVFAPRLQDNFVVRPRLIKQLNEGLSGGLILVSAPAGFGKTALLAEWARQYPVAWLSLDAGDNDPMRFWRHVLAALDSVRPGTAGRVTPALDQATPAGLERLVTILINDFAGEPDTGDLALVLDDYHVIDSQMIHSSLTFLVDHLPPQLHLVVASRVDPPLRLARVRAAGELTELGSDDLRFTMEEGAAVLSRALGPNLSLPEASVATLVDRTEGWPAGVRLAALALQGRSDGPAFVDSFSGSHRYVLDYLTEEVLEQQPQPVRDFLIETSVLERMTGDLCDAVTGRSDGVTMLEAIDRANLFLVPLDEERNWWRYHQLFADLLRSRLQQQPDHIRRLHSNAAGWYERNGMANDAIHHALAAGDHPWAARMIEREADAYLLRNEEATLDRWLAALPADVLGSRPRLLLARADLELSLGRLDAVERALDAAELAFTEAPDESYEPSIEETASLVANVPAAIAFWRAYIAELRGDAESAIAFDRQALAALGDENSVLGSAARLHLCAIELLSGEVREVEPELEAYLRSLQSVGQVYLAMRAMELLGFVQRARGRLDLALDAYREGLEIAAVPGRTLEIAAVPGWPVAAAGIAHIGLAEVAYQRGDLDTALEHVSEGVALGQRLSYRRPLAAGVATLARIRLARGDVSGAFDAVEDTPQVATSHGVSALLNPLPALWARLLLAKGDLAGAVLWAEDRGLLPDDEVSYPREPEYLILARVLLAQGRFDEALELLDRLYGRAVAQGRFGSVIEIRVLHALTLAAAGDESRAMASLAEALTLGHPQDYIRVFADEGPSMSALLRRFVAAQRLEPTTVVGVPLGYLGRLMRAFEQDANPSDSAGRHRGAGIPGLIETLSQREFEVLQLLAAGKSNRDIADELYVTIDTVKKHASHIYKKLGASNRTEATARARELGLLDDAVTHPPTA